MLEFWSAYIIDVITCSVEITPQLFCQEPKREAQKCARRFFISKPGSCFTLDQQQVNILDVFNLKYMIYRVCSGHSVTK